MVEEFENWKISEAEKFYHLLNSESAYEKLYRSTLKLLDSAMKRKIRGIVDRSNARNPLDIQGNDLRQLQGELLSELAAMSKTSSMETDKLYVGVLYFDLSTSAQTQRFPPDGSHLISVSLGLLNMLRSASATVTFLIDNGLNRDIDQAVFDLGLGVTRSQLLDRLLNLHIGVQISSGVPGSVHFARYSRLFVVGHELAHIHLGHDCSVLHNAQDVVRLDEEEAADALALSLCLSNARRRHGSPVVAYIGALIAVFVMGLEESLMIRPSITHPDPDARVEAILNSLRPSLGDTGSKNVKEVANILFNIQFLAGGILQRPLQKRIWNSVAADPRVEMAGPPKWARRKHKSVIRDLENMDWLFSRPGIDDFVSTMSQSLWEDPTGIVRDVTMQIQRGDLAVAFRHLGIDHARVQSILNRRQGLSIAELSGAIEHATTLAAIDQERRSLVAMALARLSATHLYDTSFERAIRWRLPNFPT